MSEQSTNELPLEAATAAVTAAMAQPEAVTFEPEAINLLEVMEICSDLCVMHPARLLQILEECCVSPETTLPLLFAEIMALKVSPFGRRLEQIH